MLRTRQLACKEIQKSQEDKPHYDKSSHVVQYQIGDWIMIGFSQDGSGKNRKRSRPWHGPYSFCDCPTPDVVASKVYFPEEKMEGRLCRWTLALQEFDFEIKYRRGSANGNADALSRVPAVEVEAGDTCSATLITPELTTDRIRKEQQKDAVLQQVTKHLTSRNGTSKPNWKQFPLKRYLHLLKQLHMIERFVPGPLEEVITVPVMPTSLQLEILRNCHDIISAGHQGTGKTLDRLKRVAYWVGMAKATELYCRSCEVCQQSKLPMPVAVPMTNVPIGRAWQMLAVDVLEVPMSSHGNRYLLVLQDYFTKWAEAIPMPDQTAERIVRVLI
eukprot:Em0009g535a